MIDGLVEIGEWENLWFQLGFVLASGTFSDVLGRSGTLHG